MKLNQRLKQAGVVPGTEPVEAESVPNRPAAQPRSSTVSDIRPGGDPLAAIKQRAQEALFTRLGGKLFRPEMTEDELRRMVIEEITSVVKADPAPLSPAERHRLVDDIAEDVLGLGPLEAFLADP
ncbi:MAG TPA: hypothetical protein VMZ73_05800, partial [Acidimicrobiales bacterium]|nr:hypothetical protein [Acidimicrobiales bacterium]